MPVPTLYTLVQHSGYQGGHRPAFEHAVESRAVSTRKEQEAVRKAGGVLLTGDEAYEAEEQENYPPDVQGLIPQATGTFHPRATVDGLALYLPKPLVGAAATS